MKNIKVILSFLLIVILFLGINYNKVYASYADFDENTAQQQEQQLEEKQKKELENIQNKSKNNYLQNLEVEGFTLEPEFDKQIQEYTINGEVKDSKITIKAQASDSKAKISGIGEVKLKDNSARIDVTAETGTVRTYIITFNKDKDNKNEVEEPTFEENSQSVISKMETEAAIQEETNKTNTQYGWYIVGGILLLSVLVLIVIIVISKKRKGKHF